MTRFFTRWLLPRYAAGEQLPSPLRRLVRQALERDAALAAQYNAMRRAEHVIAGDPGLSAAQLDLLLAGVLEQTDAAAARQRAPQRMARGRGRHLRRGLRRPGRRAARRRSLRTRRAQRSCAGMSRRAL